MATVNKNFKIKQGLIVEGTEATVAGNDILTKAQADQDYIVNLAGGGASTTNEPNKVVKRDGNGNFAAGTITADLVGDVTGDVTGNLNGNASTASALETARTIELTGDITGSATFNGTANIQIQTSLDADYATDAEVAIAKQEAIDAASADATSKANAAQSAAEATASADATSKANSALSSANSHTDDEIAALDLSLKAYADQAESDAVSTASADATSKANAAQSAAQTFATNADSTLHTTVTSEIATAKSEAISAASDDATSKANAAQANAEDYADSLINDASTTTTNNWSAYKINAEISAAQSAAEQHADDAVANLVGLAPSTLDTLEELSTALQNNPDVISTLQNTASGKQDTLSTGNGIVIDNNLIYVPTYIGSGVSVTPNTVEIDRDTVDTWYDAAGAASSAQSAAQTFATNADSALHTTITGEIATAKSEAISAASSDATDKANAAETAANSFTTSQITQEVADRNAAISSAISDEVTNRNSAITAAIGNLDTDLTDQINSAISQEVFNRDEAIATAINLVNTDTVEEGVNNLYFTNSRAQSAVAGDIQSAVNDVNSTIDALTTSDIAEGSNQYFTNQRAIDAVGGNINDAIAAGNSNASPTYQEINFTWATKQIGTYTWVPNSGVATVYSWNGNSYPAAKFLVRVREGQHSQVSEVLVTKDDNGNVAITEYAIVHTNGVLGDISAEFLNGTYTLTVDTVNNSTEVIVSGMLLAYGD